MDATVNWTPTRQVALMVACTALWCLRLPGYLCSSCMQDCSVSCSCEFSWPLCCSFSSSRLFSCLRASHSLRLCSSLAVLLARVSRSFSFSFCLSARDGERPHVLVSLLARPSVFVSVLQRVFRWFFFTSGPDVELLLQRLVLPPEESNLFGQLALLLVAVDEDVRCCWERASLHVQIIFPSQNTTNKYVWIRDVKNESLID